MSPLFVLAIMVVLTLAVDLLTAPRYRGSKGV